MKPQRYRRATAEQGGGMVEDPEGQWVHVQDVADDSGPWALDDLEPSQPDLREAHDAGHLVTQAARDLWAVIQQWDDFYGALCAIEEEAAALASQPAPAAVREPTDA